LRATLSGAEEVPPNNSAASGTASVELSDANGDGISDGGRYRVDYSGLPTANAAHIHVGARGEAGPVIFPLSNPAGGVGSPLEGSLDASNFTPQPAQGINNLDDAWRALREGRAYVNVHSPAYPNGEIRGQLEPAAQPSPSPSASSSPSPSPSASAGAGSPGTVGLPGSGGGSSGGGYTY
jgi:hypothetical protein